MMTTAALLRGVLTRLAIIMVIVAGISGPAITPAAAQDESASAPEPSPTVPAPTVVPTLVPTPTPVPTIAPTPTPVPPTPTPLPTDVPAPTAAPTQEVPATVTPAGTVETPPTTTATASPTVTATVEPTPTQAPDTIDCAKLAATQRGTTWQFDSTCAYTINSARSGTRIETAVSAADSNGWTVQLRPTGGDWTVPDTTAVLADAQRQAGATITFDLRVLAPATATAGQQATIAVSSQITDSQGISDGPTITLSATIPNTVSRQTAGNTSIVAQPQPSVLSCTGPNGDKILPGQTLTYQCQFSVTYLNPGKVVTTITSSISAGWDIGLTSNFAGIGSPASPMNGDGTAQIQITSQSSSLSGTITVSVKAPVSVVIGDIGTLTLASDCDKSQACPGSAQKGSFTIATTVVAPTPCSSPEDTSVTASLVEGSLPAVPFAYTAQTNTGTMTMTVLNPTQCSGWNVDISATDLTYSGAAPGQPSIPASNLRVSGTGVSTVQLATTSQRLVTNGGTDSAYTYQLTLTLDIPAGAPAGAYTGTITVTTTSAP